MPGGLQPGPCSPPAAYRPAPFIPVLSPYRGTGLRLLPSACPPGMKGRCQPARCLCDTRCTGDRIYCPAGTGPAGCSCNSSKISLLARCQQNDRPRHERGRVTMGVKVRIDARLRPSLSVHTACWAASGHGRLSVAARWKWGSLGPFCHGNVWSFHGSPCVLRVPLGHAVLECWGGVGELGSLGQAPGVREGAAARPVGRHSRRPFPVLFEAWPGELQGGHLEAGLCVAPAAP